MAQGLLLDLPKFDGWAGLGALRAANIGTRGATIAGRCGVL